MAATNVMTESLQPAGTYTSAPLPWAAGLLNVQATVLMSAQDTADSTKKLTLAIESSFDGGLSFSESVRTPWNGNTLDKNGNPVPPQISVGFAANNTPSHARVRIELPAPMSVGATLENM